MPVVGEMGKRILKNQYPKPDHLIVHISDTHLLAGDENLYASTVNSENNLIELLNGLEASGCKPEAIVFTGDIADEGESKAYRKILNIVNPVAEKMGAKIIWIMGNHDDRQNFRINLLDEYPSETTIDKVYNINGLRIIALDTSVIGHHYGEISDDQLAWLKGILTTPAEQGTILAMHHPPIPSVLDLAIAVELQDQDKLAEVIKGSDIRSIIAGHLHYSSNSTFAQIPVSVASSTCYTQDLNVKLGGIRGQDGAQGFNLIHVYKDTIVHSVVPIGSFPTVGKFISAEETKKILDGNEEEGLLKPVLT